MSKTNIPDPSEIELNEKTKRAYIQKVTEQQQPEPTPEPEEPTPVEPGKPQAFEPQPQAADQEAATSAAAGISFPMPGTRPQPHKEVKKEGNVIVAEKLAEQLGTSPELKAQMRIDERKMGVFSNAEVPALAHFSYRYVYDRVRYWGHITEWQLTGSQGVGGLGRKHILQALANTSGVQGAEKAKKPNIIARNLWDKNWKQNAEMRGEITEE